MKRRLIIICLSIVVVLLVAGIAFYKMSLKPMYEVGNVVKGINRTAPLEPPVQVNNENYFLVEDGVKLHYFTQGTGKKVLIIHGGPGMPYRGAWTALNELTDQYQFIYYDQRGCGASTRPIDTFESDDYYNNMQQLESTLGLTAQIADIERIRRILGDEKLIIIGHSFGGFMASLYAAEFPEHVEKLILVAPAQLLKMPMETDDLFANIKKRLPKNKIADYEAFVKRYFGYQNIFKHSDQDLVDLNNELGNYFSLAYLGTSYQAPANGLAGGWMIQAMYFSMGKKHDYTKAMQGLDIKTLIIHPSDDFVQTEAASKAYLEAFKSAEFVTVDNAGHAVFDDAPNLFADVIKTYLSQ